MRVLLTCQPSLGHFEPLAPLARALERAGHQAVFATSASFARVLSDRGVAAEPVGLDWTEPEVDRAFPDLVRDAADLQRNRNAWSMVFARTASAALPDLLRLATSLRPDVVVCEGIEFAGALAAEAAGIPHARVGIAAFRPPVLAAAGLGALYNQLRIGLGLRSDPNLERYCPHLYLDLYPPSLQSLAPHELLPVTRPLRPEPYAGAGRPDWLDDLDGDAPVVLVTLGTVFNRTPGTYELLLAALRDEPVSLVVAIGANRDPAELGPQPPNVRLVGSISLPHVLPAADAVLCHAPYTTLIAALCGAVPMVCLPLAADQLYNAFRVAACGAGLRLDWRGLTPDAVRGAVRCVLEEEVFRQNARRLRREIEALPPVEAGVEHLERLCADRTR